ncbi:MAG: nucleotide exchange factor GrpE [Hyphomicrobiaceae bacterium]
MTSEPKADEPKVTPPATAEPVAQAPAVDAAPEHAKSYVDPSIAAELAMTKLEAQVKDLTDRLLRAHAEMDNIRKRTERDKADTIKYAISKFAGDIVTVGDNFQRAISAVPAGAAEADSALKSLVEGVTLTEREFLGVLERHGVKRLDPKGQAFDPNFHQAVMEQDNRDVPAGTILQVFQVGYQIEDRILRPAMVIVSKGGFKPMKPVEMTPEAEGPTAVANPSNGEPGKDS